MAQITVIGETNHGHEKQAKEIQEIASASSPDALFLELDPNDPEVGQGMYQEIARDVCDRGSYTASEAIGVSTKHQRLAHLCDVRGTEPYFVDTGRTEVYEKAAKNVPRFPDTAQGIREQVSNILGNDRETAQDELQDLRGIARLLRNPIRDVRMAENIDRIVQEENYSHGVSVVGDWHVDGVSDRLEEEGHTVVSIRYSEQNGTVYDERGPWYVET